MRTINGALATGLIVATTASGLMIGAALAADAPATPMPKVEANSTPAVSTPKAVAVPVAPAAAAAKTKVSSPAAVGTDSTAAKVDRTKMPKQAKLSSHRVQQIQTALDQSGANIAIDGIWGPKTTGAIKAFQKTHGLAVTGHLDRATVKDLPKIV